MTGRGTTMLEPGTLDRGLNGWEIIEAGEHWEIAEQYFKDGVSLGTAGSALGISRNAVLQAVRRGRLEGYAVRIKSNKRMVYLVSIQSIEKYKQTRRLTKQPTIETEFASNTTRPAEAD